MQSPELTLDLLNQKLQSWEEPSNRFSGGPACGAHFLEFTTAFSLSKAFSLRGWRS